MRVADDIARSIVRGAITGPFRQVDCLDTGRFSSWLADRGLSFPEETILRLWITGMVHPVAVQERAVTAIDDPNRFLRSGRFHTHRWFVDRGRYVPKRWQLATIPPGVLRQHVLWHPFQLWEFDRLGAMLRTYIGGSLPLYGIAAVQRALALTFRDMDDRLSGWSNSAEHSEFVRVLALALHAEPLVHLDLERSFRVSEFARTSEDYFRWIASQRNVARALPSTLRLSRPRIEYWHERIATWAALDDPVENLRPLLRHVSPDSMRRTGGQVLKASSLYGMAETIRRFAERYLGMTLREEDDFRGVPLGSAGKSRVYGVPRTFERDRRTVRRVARHFGIDPQARTTWFLEGDSEFHFVRRLAERSGLDLADAGIMIMRLHGKDAVKDPKFREGLLRYRAEETFVQVTVDEDGGGKHLSTLRAFAKDDLLPAGFKVFSPDFEDSNFDRSELAAIINQMMAEEGLSASLTTADIASATVTKQGAGRAVGEAIKSLLSSRGVSWGKGEAWGRRLADWCFEHEPPHSVATDGVRPIAAVLQQMMRGQWSDYAGSVERYFVDGDGHIKPRPSAAN